ncbi:glycosyltransferase family 4 protein [Paenibacillus allorhizosphaerae]|uniref:glycosyltransferase family 4 protein n=1 Tax=Paenibacillus allorhizosphaerae TaxID=2849866 RepID=UPI001E50FC40|nr:glycosyltransferase family 4 protein [Paenibacillus allorhizosphaerae]
MKNAKKLNIVQVISNAPDTNPLPPTNQGGTEKVVYELTQELIRRGHKVSLFAASGSRTSARDIPFPKHMTGDSIRKYVLKKMPRGVDIIHDHTFPSILGRAKLPIPVVCTFHLPMKHRVPNPVYVSKRARKVMGKNRGFYVYNGINPRDYEFSERKGSYLLFMGRVLEEKGILQAIHIAERTNKKLLIAGPIKDFALYTKKIVPRIRNNPNIKYVGAVGGKRKQQLLKHAQCLLFPTLWEEPFGLVMIEAMACGTPVVALNNGAVPEVMAKFPGLVCRSVKEMIRKVQQGRFPSPRVLRKYVLSRFTTAKMTDQYLKIYRYVIMRRNSKTAFLRR